MENVDRSQVSIVVFSLLLLFLGIVLAGCGPANMNPQAKISTSPSSDKEYVLIEPGQQISFESASSDPDGEIVSYDWDFKSNKEEEATATGASVKFTYQKKGAYTVTLTVTDDGGVTATASVEVKVTKKPSASFTANPQIDVAPLQVELDATGSSDPDGSIVSYNWDFGDGKSATGAKVTHTFNKSAEVTKEYTVVLTVKDDIGARANAEKIIIALKIPDHPG